MAQQKLLKFKELNDRLLSSVRHYLESWLPQGKAQGNEYVVGSLAGESGRSLSINMTTGKWKDFSSGEAGGDLIALYAAIKNIKMGDAYRELGNDAPTKKVAAPVQSFKVGQPPKEVTKPNFKHKKYGEPSAIYNYRDESGDTLLYIARYDYVDEKGRDRKHISPRSWDLQTGKWIARQWPEMRPLFGLETLTDKVLLVEGEKAALAAREHIKGLSVVTWSGGCKAIDKTNWAPLYGKRVLMWPDHDDEGRQAMAKIAQKLIGKCEAIKIINTTDDSLSEGFDAADYNWEHNWSKWARENAVEVKLPEPEPEPPMPVERTPAKHPEPSRDIKGLMFTDSHKIICSAFNASLILYNSTLKGRVWLDSFFMDYMTDLTPFGGGSLKQSESLTDGVILKARMFLQKTSGFEKITRSDVEDALRMMAEQDIRNEPLDWLKSLKWDHTPRLDNWLIDYGGAEDNEFVRAVSKNMVLAMCKRIKHPGSKFDHVPILHAGQGAGKSQLLRVMAGRYFSELTSSIKRNGKDALLAFKSKFLVEISEGAALAGMSNDEKKAFITSEVDHYRAPYARAAKSHPRTAIICITTNNYDILDDITGDRRYWPVKLGHCRYEELKEVREQLFAEAYYRLQLDENYFEVPYELAEQARDEFTFEDDLDYEIVSYADSRSSDYVRGKDIYKSVINDNDNDMKQFSKYIQRRIGSVLRKAGYKKSTRYIDGKKAKVYVRSLENSSAKSHSLRPDGI